MERRGEADKGGRWVSMNEMIEELTQVEIDESAGPRYDFSSKEEGEATEHGPETDAVHLIGVEVDPLDENPTDTL